MKRRIALMFVGMMLMGVVSAEASDIKITVDGSELATEVTPVQNNGRTLVPFRAIADSLGAQVKWDDSAKKVTCAKDGITLELTVNSNIMLKNGMAIQLDTTPVILQGRVLVPVRAISEGFGARVSWYGVERLVVIRTDLENTVQSEEGAKIQVTIENESNTVKDKRGNTVFVSSLEKPVVSGTNADKINESIEANLKYYFESNCKDLASEAEISADVAYAQHTSIKPYTFTGKTKITCQNEDYVSMLITCTATGGELDMGAYKTGEMLLPLTYNIKTGEIVKLSDFTYKTVARAKGGIVSKIKTMDNGWYDDFAERADRLEPKFYMTPAGVVFAYDSGYLGREKNGAVACTIEWKNVEISK